MNKYIKTMRRYFHMYPQTSMKEYETTTKIAQELKKNNIDYRICNDNRGIIAHIKSKEKKGTIALRSEIDALKLKEENETLYKSKNIGVMHACGHDAHIAILLGTLIMLNNIKDTLDVDVYGVFQSDEEIARGALKMIDFKNWYEDIDVILSIHTSVDIKNNEFFVKKGNIIEGAKSFIIKNISFSEKLNLEKVIDKFIKENNSICKNYQDDYIKIDIKKQKSRVVVRCSITTDDKKILNINIKNTKKCENFIKTSKKNHNIRGIIHYYSKEKLRAIQSDINNIILQNTINPSIQIEYNPITLPVINDDAMCDIAIQALGELSIKNKIIDTIDGGEDFGYYSNKKDIKSLYVFMGVRDENKTYQKPHTSRFDIDDSNLILGSNFYIEFIKLYSNLLG